MAKRIKLSKKAYGKITTIINKEKQEKQEFEENEILFTECLQKRICPKCGKGDLRAKHIKFLYFEGEGVNIWKYECLKCRFKTKKSYYAC